jgi:hypothetical protein
LLFSTTEDPLDSTPPSFFSQYPSLLFLFKEKQNPKQQAAAAAVPERKQWENTDTILRPSFKTPPRQTQPNEKASAKLPSRNRPHEPNSRREKKEGRVESRGSSVVEKSNSGQEKRYELRGRRRSEQAKA